MRTLALPKSVFSFELGPQRLLALSELAYLIKKEEEEKKMAQPNTTPKPVDWGALAVATWGTGNFPPRWIPLKSKAKAKQTN